MDQFGIRVEIETLSDGSQVGSVLTSEHLCIDCRTTEDARKLALAFAVAINNYATL